MNEAPQHLSEADFSKMVTGALQAHGIEQHLLKLLQQVNGKNGSRIALPGDAGVRINLPSAQDLCMLLVHCAHTQLQTTRIILVALNDLDTRLRQALQASGKVGDERGSQSPDAASTPEQNEATSQGSTPSRTAEQADGNPLGDIQTQTPQEPLG